MREPRAIPTGKSQQDDQRGRSPRAYASHSAEPTEDNFVAAMQSERDDAAEPLTRPKSKFWRRLALASGGLLISLGLGLAAERLIRDLFTAYDWLGWVGMALLALFVLALAVLIVREMLGVMRLRKLDALRERAADPAAHVNLALARAITDQLLDIYSNRADLARARKQFITSKDSLLDAGQMIGFAETSLMAPLDRRARTLTARSARRIALVTAVSPRALIDVAFVIYESARLARALADLYGARPGFFGFLRIVGAVIAHLAVTGGLVLTDGAVEQLLGQGLATKLSARLGEGVVNGLMTVRVGIAAIRVVRPMPFSTEKSPVVGDFVGDLIRINTEKDSA